MKVAIDGPAGSGKSTIAHELARRCDLMLLDTGAMYRSVTLACHEQRVDVHDADAVSKVAQEVRICFGTDGDGTQTVSLDGRDVTASIRMPSIDADVSAVAAVPQVREAMVAQQRALAKDHDVVAEGRDIGTVVFPDAEVKVFLTANPAARAHRRALQRNIDDPMQEQEIKRDLERRDQADSTREVAPLRPAEDAVHIDSSLMSIEEEVQQIMELIDKARQGNQLPSGGQAAGPDAQNGQGTQEAQHTDKEGDASSSRPSGRDASKDSADDKDKEAEDPNDRFYDEDMRKYPLRHRFLYLLTMLVCGGLSKLLWPWKLENGEELWNGGGGRMVIMNHVSMLDPIIIVISDWAHGRRLRPIYKSEFDKVKIANWYFARVGGIPVKRGTADIKAVRRAQRAMQRGEDILVFPEGTRVYSDDQEVTLHAGFALMAQLAKAPVVPVAIVGARDGAPGGNKPLRLHRVFMRAGKPITFEELGVKGRKKQAEAMEKEAMERVYALRADLRRDHPGKM